MTTARALVLGFVVLLAVAGCRGEPAGADPTFRLERHTWGGLCPEGPCGSTLTVGPDGAWTLTTEGGDDSGRLEEDELAALVEAAVGSRLSAAPQTTRCEADADGTSVRYVWTVRGAQSVASSCEVAFDEDDPLVEAAERLAANLVSARDR